MAGGFGTGGRQRGRAPILSQNTLIRTGQAEARDPGMPFPRPCFLQDPARPLITGQSVSWSPHSAAARRRRSRQRITPFSFPGGPLQDEKERNHSPPTALYLQTNEDGLRLLSFCSSIFYQLQAVLSRETCRAAAPFSLLP